MQQNQKAFWSLRDFLFSHKKEITQSSLQSLLGSFVNEEKLDKSKFDQCMNNGQTLTDINADIQAGREHGVRSTPTVFLNGFKLEGIWTGDQLKTFIRENDILGEKVVK